MNHVEEIIRLKKLLDDGAISKKEFEKLKKEVIQEMEGSKTAKDPDQTEKTGKEATALSEKREQPGARGKEVPLKHQDEQAPEVEHKRNVEKQAEASKEMIDTTAHPKNTRNQVLFVFVILSAATLSILFYRKYESPVALISMLALSVGLPSLLFSRINRSSNGALFLVGFIVLYIVLSFLPADRQVDASSKNHDINSSTQEQADEPVNESRRIAQFLIDNRFACYETGGTSYLTFESDHGGWFGAMIMSIGQCDFVYSYNLEGRTIDLIYTGSTCTGFQGSSNTMTFNDNNTISFMISGQRFIFHPMK